MRMLPAFLLLLCFHNCRSQTTIASDSGYYASFDSTKIYYETRGQGKAVLLVHGFIVDGSSWERSALLADLVQKGFKVITADLRGNGKSDKPMVETAYANDAEAKDLIGLMKYLGIGSYDVVGYSRGAIITARLLVLDNHVKHAVLGGMSADFTNPDWPRRLLFYKALSGEPVKELEGMVKNVKARGLNTNVLAWLQKYQPSTSPAQLGRVQTPVLVISGDRDLDNGSPKELAALFQKATLVFVPGDHNHTSATKEFSQAILTFLNQ